MDELNKLSKNELINEIIRLRKHESHISRLVDSLGDKYCLFSHTPEGIFTYVSSGFKTVWGLEPEEVTGKNWRELNLFDESIEDGEATDDKTTSEKTTESVVLKYNHPNGSKRIIEVVQSPIFLDSDVTAIEGICIDITEQKLAEEGLIKAKDNAEESERTFRKLFEDSSDAILLINKKGVFVECNQAALDLLKMTREEFIFQPPVNISPQYQPNGRKSEEAALEMIDLAYKNGLHRFDWTCLNSMGEEFIVEVSLMPISVKGETMLHTTWRDVTERSMTEKAIARKVEALTKPGDDDIGSIAFEELFNIDDIQRLQDEFAKATGVASIITHTDGRPITKPSNFCHLCSDIIRKTEKGCANCYKSDAVIGSYHPEGPVIQQCLSGGLWDAGAAISVGGKHCANWLIGQVRDETQTEEKMRAYAREIETDEEAFIKAFHEVPSMSRERFGNIAKVLFSLANQLSTLAYHNLQQARFISAQKLAKEALKESERKNKAWIENSPVCTKVVDLDFNLQFMSESGIRELNIEDINNHYGKPYPFYFYPESFKTEMKGNLEKAKKTGEIITQEASVNDINGNKLWYHSTIVPVNNNKGKLDYLLVVSLETTERKQAEEDLRKREIELELQLEVERLTNKVSINIANAVNENIDEAINSSLEELARFAGSDRSTLFSFSSDTQYISNTHEWCLEPSDSQIKWLQNIPFDSFGWHRDQLLNKGKSIISRVSDYPPEAKKELEWIKEHGHRSLLFITLYIREKPVGAIGFYGPKGEDLDWPTQFINMLYTVGNVFLNAIERSRTEEKLKESEERYRSLIEVTTSIFWTTDGTGGFVTPQPSWEKFTGQPWSEQKGFGWTKKIHPDDTEHILKAWSKACKEMSLYETYGRVWNQNLEEWRDFEVKATPLINQEGTLREWVGVITDVTERKKAEQELQKQNKEYASLNEELIIAIEKAEESDHLKSAFLANMSHEIRTPMNGILGFTKLLKKPQLTGDKKEKFIQLIEKSGKRMLNTINDIIDISKIEAGQVKVEETEVSVNEILEEQYNFFYHQAKSKRLELNYRPSLMDSESRIITDPHKLEGILTNLIKNAVKYTETGGITFGCRLKDNADGKFIEFYVKDTGIGVPVDREEAIFNRFEQADISDTQVFEGSGLGLAISKSYVEMLGGDISVSSNKDSGSTFTFSIPYNKQNLKETFATQNKEEESGVAINNLSVIVAEDDETSRMLLETILEDHVTNITYTHTGKETIEKFHENPDTNIILMDIKMPDLNGYDATREIRKFNSEVIIIAQTAHGLSGDKDKALEAGCDEYITKPIEEEILFEKIRACLDKKSI